MVANLKVRTKGAVLGKKPALIAALICSGCVGSNISHVTAIGKGEYRVFASGSNHEEPTTPIKERAYDSANAYCAKTGQSIEVIEKHEQPYSLGPGISLADRNPEYTRNAYIFELTFRCVS